MDLELEKLSISDEVSETGWFDIIPFELRIMIIDSMDTKSKCRFAICSKKCAEEVEMSGNGIELLMILEPASEIDILVRSHDITRSIKFSENQSTGNIDVKCEDYFSSRIIWETEEAGLYSDVILKYFDYFMKNATKSLKWFLVLNNDFPIYENRSIKKLKNLEMIILPRELDFEYFDFQKICRIEKILSLKIPTLSIDQLFQIKAGDIDIYGLKWTIPDINTFLKRCIDGELKETVEIIRLDFDELIPDKKIFKDLSIVAETDRYEINDYLLEYKNPSEYFLTVTIAIGSKLLIVCPREHKIKSINREIWNC